MPREKRVQPQPLESGCAEDFVWEVYDDSKCSEIGRGSHKREAYIKKFNSTLKMVVKDYFEEKPHEGGLGAYKGRVKGDYLKSGSAFIRKLEDMGWQGPEGRSVDWNRRKLYPDLLLNVRALKKALEVARYDLHPN